MHRQYDQSLQLKENYGSTVYGLGLHGEVNYASQSSLPLGHVFSCSVSMQLLSDSGENQSNMGSGVTEVAGQISNWKVEMHSTSKLVSA